MQTGTLAFLLGVWLVQLQPVLPSISWLLVAIVIFLPFYRRQRYPVSLALAFFTGLLWATLYAQLRLDDALPAGLEGEEVVVIGEVTTLPERAARRSRFLFEVERLEHQGRHFESPSRIRLSWYEGAPELVPGQRWQLKVKLKRPHGMMNPGGFDYEQWLFQQGIRATGYVRNWSDNRLLEEGLGAAPVERLRYRLQQRLSASLEGEEFGGMIRALAIGDRGGISDEQWALLLDTGTNHLMAISGLHIGLVAGLVYLLALRLWCLSAAACLWLPAPRAAAVAAVAAAIGYAALAGFSVPTQRAMLMLALLMGAIFWMRPIRPARVLSIVLLLVMLHDPLVVLSPGFWLSFAAVAVILFGMGGRLNPGGLWWRWGRVQWLVALGLSPLLLLLFGQAALVAPLANLLAVPMVGLVVVPLTLTGTLLLPLWQWGGASLLHLAAWLTAQLWPLLQFLAEVLPALQLATAPWWAYLLALPGLVWLLAPRGWPLRLAGIVPLMPLLLWQPQSLEEGAARFTLLDVGQGLAAVVETRHHLLVFDTGQRFPSGFNTGESVLLPYLRYQGWAAIDALIISHGDNDHIGGARVLAEALPVWRVVTSVPHKMGWIAHESCRRGDSWQWDGVEFQLLHPERLIGKGRGNNDSCVLRVKAGDEALLLTGDIEVEAERELTALYGDKLRADTLIAPHHGSKTSSSERFIAAVMPKRVLMPLGYRNRYGFPHQQVRERYERRGIPMLSSSASGAIGLTLGRGRPEVVEYRKFSRRYWHSNDL